MQQDRCSIVGALRPVLPGLQVASLQAMVVYYRDLCGVPKKLGKMSVYDEPDPDEYCPLQDLDFSLGEEPPAEQQDHYMVCI